MARYCKSCGKALTEDMKFCRNCGTPVPEVPTEKRFCRSCGRELAAGAMFCAACGTRVGESAPTEVPTPARHSASAPAAPQPSRAYAPRRNDTPPQQVYAQSPAPQPKAKKKGKGLIVLLVLLVVAGVGWFGFREGGFLRGLLGDKPVAKPSSGGKTQGGYSLSGAEALFGEGAEVKVEPVKGSRAAALREPDKYELLGDPLELSCDKYDGTFFGEDVVLSVPIPDMEDPERYVFVYYDEVNGEARYLFPDGYDASKKTMEIALPHFSLFGPAKLTEEEEIEVFLDKYSTKKAVQEGQDQLAASELEPYIRAKAEAMGLKDQALKDLVQSTINIIGGRFKGDDLTPTKSYGDTVETITKTTTAVTRGIVEGDWDTARTGLEDAVNGALVHAWEDLQFSQNIDRVLDSEFAGRTAVKALGSATSIIRMNKHLSEGTEEGFKEAMKELGNIFQSVHPAVELGTKGVAFLGAQVNQTFTNWKSNQVEELYQIYKNGLEDVWHNEVIPGNRESFLTYLNTASGFTMAKGVKRFYNMDKVAEICKKYGWPYSRYEDLPDRYKEKFDKLAEDGLMEYFELRLQQETRAAEIKEVERVVIETMMNDYYGALRSGNYGAYFGEQSPNDYSLSNRLERLVNVRSFVSNFVDEQKLEKMRKDGSFNYGDVLNWWVEFASKYERTEAILKFRERLLEHDLLKDYGDMLVTALILEKTIGSGKSDPVGQYVTYERGWTVVYDEKAEDIEEYTDESPEMDVHATYSKEVRQLFERYPEIPLDKKGNFSLNSGGLKMQGAFDQVTRSGTGTFSIYLTYTQTSPDTPDVIREKVEDSGIWENFWPWVSREATLSVSGDLELKPDPDTGGVRIIFNGSGSLSYSGTRITAIKGIKYPKYEDSDLVIETAPYSGGYDVTFENVTNIYSMD